MGLSKQFGFSGQEWFEDAPASKPAKKSTKNHSSSHTGENISDSRNADAFRANSLIKKRSYEYKMVQISSGLIVSAKARNGNEAADYMQQVIDKEAVEDWEFYRVDSISVEEKPGCIASLIGLGSTFHNYHVISFRRLRKDDKGSQSSSESKNQPHAYVGATAPNIRGNNLSNHNTVKESKSPQHSENSGNDSDKTDQPRYF